MSTKIDTAAQAQLFTEARSFNAFLDKEVSEELIEELYELMKWGPTSMNCQPGYFVVVKSAEAKRKIK